MKNGDNVSLAHTSISGVIISECHHADGTKEFRIRYEDNNGLAIDYWYRETELTVIDVAPALSSV